MRLVDSELANYIEVELNSAGVVGGAIRTPVPIAKSAAFMANCFESRADIGISRGKR